LGLVVQELLAPAHPELTLFLALLHLLAVVMEQEVRRHFLTLLVATVVLVAVEAITLVLVELETPLQ
jgi:hypothetical protein